MFLAISQPMVRWEDGNAPLSNEFAPLRAYLCARRPYWRIYGNYVFTSSQSPTVLMIFFLFSQQTLREMYSDLELRYNSHPPNEPEFRAYMVLMKLNEGDILRYIQFIIASLLLHYVTTRTLQMNQSSELIWCLWSLMKETSWGTVYSDLGLQEFRLSSLEGMSFPSLGDFAAFSSLGTNIAVPVYHHRVRCDGKSTRVISLRLMVCHHCLLCNQLIVYHHIVKFTIT